MSHFGAAGRDCRLPSFRNTGATRMRPDEAAPAMVAAICTAFALAGRPRPRRARSGARPSGVASTSYLLVHQRAKAWGAAYAADRSRARSGHVLVIPPRRPPDRRTAARQLRCAAAPIDAASMAMTTPGPGQASCPSTISTRSGVPSTAPAGRSDKGGACP